MVTRSEKSEPVNYSKDDWYLDIYHYYTNQKSFSVDRIRHAVIKNQAHYYRYNSFIKRLLKQVGRYWAICLIKLEVAPILHKIHDHVDYFVFKIVLYCLRFQVFWPKMAFDARKYIQECLSFAKWATAT